MIKETDLVVGACYKVRTGNTFLLFREYGPNVECFKRQDGMIFMGRDFIEYRDGLRFLDLTILEDEK